MNVYKHKLMRIFTLLSMMRTGTALIILDRTGIIKIYFFSQADSVLSYPGSKNYHIRSSPENIDGSNLKAYEIIKKVYLCLCF